MNKPKLSIGLPVYNGENFLAEAIESVLNQDFKDFELIISDNASEDRTAEICARYAAKDRRVRYYRAEKNRGAAWNFNHVFEMSVGEYFKWQAHDDLCLPGFLQRCVETLDRAPPSVVLVHPKTEIIDEHGSRNPGFSTESLDIRLPASHRRLRDLLRRSSSFFCLSAQFGVLRTTALRQTRLIAPFPASDWALLAELAMLGEFWEVPEILFQRRFHPLMSTNAYLNPSQLLNWYDPSQSSYRRMVSPMMWLGVEYVHSIHKMPLGHLERLRCYGTVLSVWYFRQFRIIGGRYKRQLKQFFGLESTAGVA